jgi:predicted Zn finger-like uncharacterized protein
MVTELRTQCPSCSAPLRVSNFALAGKVVKCPKCGKPMRLPVAPGAAEAKGATAPATMGHAAQPSERDAALRPPRRAARYLPSLEDEGATEEAALPRRRSKRAGKARGKAGNRAKLWIFAGLGAVVLVGRIVGLLAAFGASGRRTPPARTVRAGDVRRPPRRHRPLVQPRGRVV